MLVKSYFISKLAIKSEASNSKTSLANEKALANDSHVFLMQFIFFSQKCIANLQSNEMQPSATSIIMIQWIKLLTSLRVGLSHLGAYKFKHNFNSHSNMC